MDDYIQDEIIKSVQDQKIQRELRNRADQEDFAKLILWDDFEGFDQIEKFKKIVQEYLGDISDP